jgi:xanthine dehydrogenase YagR molybdenum-binding subunit
VSTLTEAPAAPAAPPDAGDLPIVPPGGATRVEGPDKVSGRARYAYEHGPDDLAYVWPVPATIAKGVVRAVHGDAVRSLPGVLAVLAHGDVPALPGAPDPELALFQSDAVAHRGQWVAAVVASTLEGAREAAELLPVDYESEDHDVVLTVDHPGLYAPRRVNPNFPTDTEVGEPEAAWAAAPIRIDATYETPAQHNHPMEPHATVAQWDGDALTLYDSNQGVSRVQPVLAEVFGLERGQVHVMSEHVGGGFGSKGTPRPNAVLAALAARVVDRPVKCVVPRDQMPAVVGHRTPTIQRLRLGAEADGRLVSVIHDVVEHTSTRREFAEQTAVGTRHLYAAPHRRTTHRLAALDVPTPSWMRAPGECPGSFGIECAMDELAVALGIDPVELRIRNEPDVDPESGRPFSSRNLVACLREGAARFGWSERAPGPGARREGRWLVGTGVASSLYPARAAVSRATATAGADGGYGVGIAAADIGTGARTAIRLVAAESLGVAPDRVDVRIGDTELPSAMIAGGSMGMASWAWAVDLACRDLRGQLEARGGEVPPGGLSAYASTREPLAALDDLPRFTFGAQFAEARVDVDTGEVRVPRLLGVFAAGRIVNPVAARSQLVGGMTMGLSMALHEESTIDPTFGDFRQRDLASYHVAAHADVMDVEAVCLDEHEPTLGPLGIKGVGEVGIVGTAAAIANAVYHATGTRVRDLPIRLDKLLR